MFPNANEFLPILCQSGSIGLGLAETGRPKMTVNLMHPIY